MMTLRSSRVIRRPGSAPAVAAIAMSVCSPVLVRTHFVHLLAKVQFDEGPRGRPAERICSLQRHRSALQPVPTRKMGGATANDLIASYQPMARDALASALGQAFA